jgi:endo-1,4-beta-D-glucanase Y
MKTKSLFTTWLGLAVYGAVMAQNPLIHSAFCADPTARVFDGRVYVYPSHDIPPVSLPTQRPDWFCMGDYHVYSSADLTHWTDHGVILDQTDVPWGNPSAYSMWAPDCIRGKDGRYYFYFPDASQAKEGEHPGFGVGVAISDTPYGPFVAQPKPIEGILGIDPCVLQASDGKNYIFWGGGGLLQAHLADYLMSLAGEPQRITSLPEGFKEGPFAFERQGKFYLTYPWVRGKKGEPDGKGGVWENPTECLAYAMSDSPMGPWEYKGILMEEWDNGCWTNHHSLVEYEGQWYLFYHHNDYSPRFDKNRSMCADTLHFRPDGTIQTVIPSRRGVGVTEGSERVQIDRYSACSQGVDILYNDTLNPMLGWKARLAPQAWVSYGSVRIPASSFDAKGQPLKVWASVPGFFGQSRLIPLEQTAFRLDLRKQRDDLYELILTNTGSASAEVDWISVNPRQPLVPSARGGLETGTYRNLFLEAGYSQDEIDRKLEEVFHDVFYGPHKCYFEVGKDMAYISDIKNDDVRTEGMSYGLMIAVQWDKKDIFDRLWRWTQRYMQMTDGPMAGYFRWSCKRNGEANSQGPASDGELYFITSLIFASNRWGNEGEIHYLAEAQRILDAIQPREFSFPARPGGEPMKRTASLIDAKTGLISFVPGMEFTDPSYHVPAFYEVWARYAEDGRASYWRECAAKSRAYLHRSVHPFTGLTPDYNHFDGSLMQTGHLIGDAFRYDSWRVPMNIALDYSWSCVDRDWQQNYGEMIQNFFYAKGLGSFVDQYDLDGTVPSRLLRAGNYPEKLRHSIGLVATTAAASLLCSHAKSYAFIDQLWNTPHQPDADGFFDAYYDGLLRLFAFMHLSGRYQVIEKQMQLSDYLRPMGSEGFDGSKVDDEGFIRRWMLLDPISKPNRSNTVFVDSYLRQEFNKDYFKGQRQIDLGKLPKDGQRVTLLSEVSEQNSQTEGLTWNAYDSQKYNVKLYRLASCKGLPRYGVLFWAATVVYCPEEMQDVRLAVGSNSASMWWVNGEEALLLSGDRRMVKDDGMSARIRLKKGRNVIRGAVINGPGMSDFCVRLLDANGQPVKNIKVDVK